jgi:hypothetical protein
VPAHKEGLPPLRRRAAIALKTSKKTGKSLPLSEATVRTQKQRVKSQLCEPPRDNGSVARAQGTVAMPMRPLRPATLLLSPLDLEIVNRCLESRAPPLAKTAHEHRHSGANALRSASQRADGSFSPACAVSIVMAGKLESRNSRRNSTSSRVGHCLAHADVIVQQVGPLVGLELSRYHFSVTASPLSPSAAARTATLGHLFRPARGPHVSCGRTGSHS